MNQELDEGTIIFKKAELPSWHETYPPSRASETTLGYTEHDRGNYVSTSDGSPHGMNKNLITSQLKRHNHSSYYMTNYTTSYTHPYDLSHHKERHNTKQDVSNYTAAHDPRYDVLNHTVGYSSRYDVSNHNTRCEPRNEFYQPAGGSPYDASNHMAERLSVHDEDKEIKLDKTNKRSERHIKPPISNNRYTCQKLQKDMLVRTEHGFLTYLKLNNHVMLKNAWEKEIIPRKNQNDIDPLPQSSIELGINILDSIQRNSKIELLDRHSHGENGDNERGKKTRYERCSTQNESESTTRHLPSFHNTSPIMLSDTTHKQPSLISNGIRVIQQTLRQEGSNDSNVLLYHDSNSSQATVDVNIKQRCRRYLSQGSCPKNDSCRFLHAYPKEDNIFCKNYLTRTCTKRASECWYKHESDETGNIAALEEPDSDYDDERGPVPAESVGNIIALLRKSKFQPKGKQDETKVLTSKEPINKESKPLDNSKSKSKFDKDYLESNRERPVGSTRSEATEGLLEGSVSIRYENTSQIIAAVHSHLLTNSVSDNYHVTKSINKLPHAIYQSDQLKNDLKGINPTGDAFSKKNSQVENIKSVTTQQNTDRIKSDNTNQKKMPTLKSQKIHKNDPKQTEKAYKEKNCSKTTISGVQHKIKIQEIEGNGNDKISASKKIAEKVELKTCSSVILNIHASTAEISKFKEKSCIKATVSNVDHDLKKSHEEKKRKLDDLNIMKGGKLNNSKRKQSNPIRHFNIEDEVYSKPNITDCRGSIENNVVKIKSSGSSAYDINYKRENEQCKSTNPTNESNTAHSTTIRSSFEHDLSRTTSDVSERNKDYQNASHTNCNTNMKTSKHRKNGVVDNKKELETCAENIDSSKQERTQSVDGLHFESNPKNKILLKEKSSTFKDTNIHNQQRTKSIVKRHSEESEGYGSKEFSDKNVTSKRNNDGESRTKYNAQYKSELLKVDHMPLDESKGNNSKEIDNKDSLEQSNCCESNTDIRQMKSNTNIVNKTPIKNGNKGKLKEDSLKRKLDQMLVQEQNQNNEIQDGNSPRKHKSFTSIEKMDTNIPNCKTANETVNTSSHTHLGTNKSYGEEIAKQIKEQPPEHDGEIIHMGEPSEYSLCVNSTADFLKTEVMFQQDQYELPPSSETSLDDLLRTTIHMCGLNQSSKYFKKSCNFDELVMKLHDCFKVFPSIDVFISGSTKYIILEANVRVLIACAISEEEGRRVRQTILHNFRSEPNLSNYMRKYK